MRRLGTIAVMAGLALLAYLLLWPVPIHPVAWAPPPNPGFVGPYAANELLKNAELLIEGLGHGPEDVARGPEGSLYTGLGDGRIVRFGPRSSDPVQVIAETGGRPLGLQFDRHGNLIVADAFKGLLSVDPDGAVSVLSDRIDGKRMLFVDDLDIAADGTIWFTDASQDFDWNGATELLLERRPSGRLLTYDPRTTQTTVRLNGLSFANGVALGPLEAFVLVNESLAYRIRRLWLSGPKAGQDDIFLDGLPALPDNVSFNGRDKFWVAHFMPRSAALDRFSAQPFMRKVLYRLQGLLPHSETPMYGFLLGVDADGNVIDNLQDPTGFFGFTTSVNEYDGYLYVGSLEMAAVARLRVP